MQHPTPKSLLARTMKTSPFLQTQSNIPHVSVHSNKVRISTMQDFTECKNCSDPKKYSFEKQKRSSDVTSWHLEERKFINTDAVSQRREGPESVRRDSYFGDLSGCAPSVIHLPFSLQADDQWPGEDDVEDLSDDLSERHFDYGCFLFECEHHICLQDSFRTDAAQRGFLFPPSTKHHNVQYNAAWGMTTATLDCGIDQPRGKTYDVTNE